jgi:hypothetical protein
MTAFPIGASDQLGEFTTSLITAEATLLLRETDCVCYSRLLQKYINLLSAGQTFIVSMRLEA